MTKLTIAIPSKGRLQENTHDFFGRAGLKVLQPRRRAELSRRDCRTG